jgi:hypothetical protein
MKTILKHSGWLSLLLTLPALALCGAGALYLGFGLDSVNAALGAFMTWPLGKLLLSPAVVFGGLVLAIGLNAPCVCRVSADVYDGEFTVAASVKLAMSRLVPVALATLLLVLLLTYAFTENFRIIAR